MTRLKDLTWESHKRAEKCLFIKKLLKKEITPEQYYIYLSNQSIMYLVLEDFADIQELFKGIDVMKRSPKIIEDLAAMRSEYGFGHCKQNTPTTDRYVSHLRMHQNNKDILLSHIYVRHLGDLSGGQIIKRFAPVSQVKHYEFDGDPEEIKQRFKERVSAEHANEANICFDFMIDFFQDLEVQFGF